MSSSLADAQALIALAKEGRVLVFFPEGTFTRRAGLSGFYLGAFKVAAEANLPVLPGAIRGTRSLLRSDQWFPRHTAVTIEIGEPVIPSGTDFGSVLRLRDEVRKQHIVAVRRARPGRVGEAGGYSGINPEAFARSRPAIAFRPHDAFSSIGAIP